ncbi:hypothetical protein Bca52824_060986 [Brassica carinata]|uniref:Uncharacterized protein n=1 Tax=Brassica carinata TaxID=52824 RepID=A0A8X7UI50_BRACI|nr:hypothetical protein Bca52824_060986 [Brassica carinata]
MAAMFLSLGCVRRRPIDGPRGGRWMKMKRGGVVVSLPGMLDGGDWETVSGRAKAWNGTLLVTNLDLSGRAALGVHVAAYEEDKAKGTRPKKLQAEKTAEGIA